MSIKSNSHHNLKIVRPESQKVILSHLELFYLRLNVHRFCDKRISHFLDLDIQKIYALKKQIKAKYKTKIWESIIIQAFNNRTLKKIDFVPNIVMEEAVKYTNKIFGRDDSKFKIIKVKNDIVKFLQSCEEKLSAEYLFKPGEDQLLRLELTFLRLKFINTSDIAIEKKLDTTDLKTIERCVFSKLRLNNWFNVYQYAFQHGLLETKILEFKYTSVLMNICVRKIKQIELMVRLDKSERKSMVLNQLLMLYANIEFEVLLNKK